MADESFCRASARDWLILVTGLAVACWWLVLGGELVSRITVDATIAASAIFYAVVFGPLYAIALAAGLLGRMSVVMCGKRRGVWALTGTLIGLGGLATATGFAWLQGGLVANAISTDGTMLMIGCALILFQVAAEEVYFRGWLQALLARIAGLRAAVVITALMFMAFHVVGGARGVLALTNISLAGLLFGLLMVRSGGIVASIAAHFAWNASETLLFGLLPNPGVDQFTTILDLDLAGSPMWGGNPDGLNASIGTTAALLALVLPLLALSRRDSPPSSSAAGVGFQAA